MSFQSTFLSISQLLNINFQLSFSMRHSPNFHHGGACKYFKLEEFNLICFVYRAIDFSWAMVRLCSLNLEMITLNSLIVMYGIVKKLLMIMALNDTYKFRKSPCLK